MLSKYVCLQINNQTFTVLKGEILLNIIQKEGFFLPNYCSGQGICGKCKVKLSGMFSDITVEEKKNLSAEDQVDGIRLACQVVVKGDGNVWIEDERNPVIVSAGTRSVDMGKYRPPILLSTLDKKDTQKGVYGVAFDIGTTTVVAYLVDLLTGEELDSASLLNPQRVYGDDVLSRISYCDKPEGLAILHNVIGGAMNGLIGELCELQSINTEEIYECLIVGNPTMCQLFLNINPYSIGKSPYKPAYHSSLYLSAFASGLGINPAGKVTVLPNISGYIGSDTIAGILASGIYNDNKPGVLMDIGTNAEIVVIDKKRMIACSAAAGPAFEGGGIQLGMRAVEGAVCSIGEDGLGIIGDKKPRGFCGSGIIDAVAYLLDNGILNSKGILKPNNAVNMVKNQAAYFFAESLFLTQNDIAELQLAKAAVYTALE